MMNCKFGIGFEDGISSNDGRDGDLNKPCYVSLCWIHVVPYRFAS
jgi:hypothetical protein